MTGPSTTEPSAERRRTQRHQSRQVRRRYPSYGSAPSIPTTTGAPPADRQQLGIAHDIGHACGTVLMLAAALERAPELDVGTRRFAEQLAVETRRMNDMVTDLLRVRADERAVNLGPTSVRLDTLIESVVGPIRSTSRVRIDVHLTPVTVGQEPLALWRALRNLIGNALQAVEPDGLIRIELTSCDGFAIVDIDDDGPGLGDDPPREGGLGLTIVEDLAAGWRGWFELGAGPLGGCRARLIVPLPTTASPADGTGHADHPL